MAGGQWRLTNMGKSIKILVSTVLLFFSFLSVCAQKNEPMCNIGKSLGQMRTEGYNLGYRGTTQNGNEKYIDINNSGDGFLYEFVANNGRIIEESMVILDVPNEFARKFHDSLRSKMESGYSWAIVSKNNNLILFNFSYFTVELTIETDNSKNAENMHLIYRQK